VSGYFILEAVNLSCRFEIQFALMLKLFMLRMRYIALKLIFLPCISFMCVSISEKTSLDTLS
jgi:hypothetical protein